MTTAVHCVVLAAGLSRRFGASKLLVPVAGEALIRRVMRTVCDARVGPTHLVVGHDGDRVRAAAGDLSDTVVDNPRYRDGLGTSIAAGVASLPREAEAVLIVLGDQPLVRADHLRLLAAAWAANPGHIAASGYSGTAGPPVVFPRAAFAELETLDSDEGAKRLLDGERYPLRIIDAGDQALDVDTRADLDALRGG